MDHKYIEQFDLIDRYLMGKLPEDESERFEEHFVDCPACAGRLKVMGDFLDDLRMEAAELASETASDGAKRPFSFFTGAFSGKVLAVAVICLLLAATAGTVLMANRVWLLSRELDQAKDNSAELQRLYDEQRQTASVSANKLEEVEQGLAGRVAELEAKLQGQEQTGGDQSPPDVWSRPRINLPVIVLESVRSGEGGSTESVNEVQLSRSQTEFVISIPLEGETQYSDYRIKIVDEKESTVLEKAGLKPDSRGSLTLGFGSSMFQPGRHLVRVYGISRQGAPTTIGDYPLRIIKKRSRNLR
jgi:hypothetical protein